MEDRSGRADRRRRRDDRGAVLVEFAIASVLFLGLIYGTVSYGVVFWVKSTITHAASEGARASIGSDDPAGTAKQKAEDVIDATLPSGYRIHAKPVSVVEGNCPDNPSASCVTVTVTYPYSSHPIVPALPPVFPFLPSQLKSTSVVQL